MLEYKKLMSDVTERNLGMIQEQKSDVMTWWTVRVDERTFGTIPWQKVTRHSIPGVKELFRVKNENLK